jgi:hypothetical protein
MLMIINKSVEFCKKKKLVLSVWAEGRSLLQIDNGILDWKQPLQLNVGVREEAEMCLFGETENIQFSRSF